MKGQTRALSLTAVSAAGAVVMLYLGTVFPTMHLSFAALAAVFVAICVIEGGLRYGAFCFLATAMLGLLLVPDRTGVFLYLSFFGAYPLVKSLAERQWFWRLQWGVSRKRDNIAFSSDGFPAKEGLTNHLTVGCSVFHSL